MKTNNQHLFTNRPKIYQKSRDSKMQKINYNRSEYGGINLDSQTKENFNFQRISSEKTSVDDFEERYCNSTINENVEEENMSSNLNSIFSTPSHLNKNSACEEINFFKKQSSKNLNNSRMKSSSCKYKGGYFKSSKKIPTEATFEYEMSTQKKSGTKKFFYSESLEKILNKNMQKSDMDFISKQESIDEVKQSINFNLVSKTEDELDFCKSTSKENIVGSDSRNLKIEIERIRMGMIKKSEDEYLSRTRPDTATGVDELRKSEEAELEYYPESTFNVNLTFLKKNLISSNQGKVPIEDFEGRKMVLTNKKTVGDVTDEAFLDKTGVINTETEDINITTSNAEDYQSAKFMIKKQLRKLEKKFKLLNKQKFSIYSPISKEYSVENSSCKSKASLKLQKTPSSFITNFATNTYDSSFVSHKGNKMRTAKSKSKSKSKYFSMKKWMKGKSACKENLSFAYTGSPLTKVQVYNTRNTSFKKKKNFMKNGNSSVSKILKNIDSYWESPNRSRNLFVLKEKKSKISQKSVKPPKSSNGSSKKFTIPSVPNIRFEKLKKSLSRRNYSKIPNRKEVSPIRTDKNSKLYSIVKAVNGKENRRYNSKKVSVFDNLRGRKSSKCSRKPSKSIKGSRSKHVQKFDVKRKRGNSRKNSKSKSSRMRNQFFNQFSVSPISNSRRTNKSIFTGNQFYSGSINIFQRNLRNLSRSGRRRSKQKKITSKSRRNRAKGKRTPSQRKKPALATTYKTSRRDQGSHSMLQ